MPRTPSRSNTFKGNELNDILSFRKEINDMYNNIILGNLNLVQQCYYLENY